jgi:hypothetical protein
MDIVQRAKNICLTPATEWPVIAAEPASVGELLTGYFAPLAAIGAIAGFIGGSIIGITLPFVGHYRVPMFSGLISAVFTLGMAVVGVFVLSLVIDALAPTFGGEKNSIQALKVAVYSYTPALLAGVLRIVPVLGILAIFAAIYGLYLLYLGLPRLMKCPQDKAIPYTVIVVVCAIVLTIVTGLIAAAIVGTGMAGAGALTGVNRSSSSEVQFDKNSALGKLQELGKAVEDSSKKAEAAAAKSGDPNAQAAGAVAGLGALLGGGKHVDPVGIDVLKPLIPDTFGGLAKTSSNAQKSGFAGFMVSKAEARYGDAAGKSVTLEISDTGGVSGIMALAGWAGVEGESEDDSGSEKTHKVDGRLMHEKISKNGGTNEFAVVVGDRFVVSAKGRGVDLAALKAGISSIDLAKLESMKDAGVSK